MAQLETLVFEVSLGTTQGLKLRLAVSSLTVMEG